MEGRTERGREGGMEGERERDVDNKLRNLLTCSKQLNLVSSCWPRGTLVRDNKGLISTVCRSTFLNWMKSQISFFLFGSNNVKFVFLKKGSKRTFFLKKKQNNPNQLINGYM